MSNLTPLTEQTSLQNAWRRLIDKLAGGPPNQAKLDALKSKRWYDKYMYTIYAFSTCFTFFTVPTAISYQENHPFSSTPQTLQGLVVRMRENIPHLTVELQDGSIRKMEWPEPIKFQGLYRSYVWSDAEREHLPGCLTTVRGVPPHKVNDTRFQIWELNCSEQAIHLKADQSHNNSYLGINSELLSTLFHISLSYLCVWVVYLREKRGNV